MALSSCVLVTGCKKPPPPDAEQKEAPPPVTHQVPEDHVGSDTLVPGTAKAYALVLPFGFSVQAQIDREIAVVGQAPPKKVINYIKERVRDGKLIEGHDDTERSVFEGVRIPDEPDRYLQISVSAHRGTTLINVKDVTPAPPLPPTSEAERYKQVGMDPRGHLLHPHTIE